MSERTIPKSTLSQHFKALRDAGLIRGERRGIEMHNTSRCAAWSGANQWQTRSSSGGPVTTPPNHPSGSGPQENQDEPPPGAWRPTPPAFLPYLSPHWGQVTPFAIPTGDFFRPNGPPALACAKYAADYNEVKGLGAAVGSSRTLERTEIALFWSGGAGTVTPPGDWNVSSPRMSLPFAGTPCAKRTPLRPDSSPLINPPPVRRKATFPLLWPLSRLRTVILARIRRRPSCPGNE